ncbi:MAG: Na-translocating system protein MpsC family protein [Solirubrobacteraceae bacterium]
MSSGERLIGERTEALARVCKAVVHIHKRFYGKGPTKARAHLSEDLLTVVLEGGFTRGEETLRRSGHEDDVLRSRLAMKRSVEGISCDAIEDAVGRSVRSFMSACDPAGGIQVEVFVLEPRSGSLGGGRSTGYGDRSADDVDPSEDGLEVGSVAEGLSTRAREARERHREILDEHRALRAEQLQSRRAVERERDRLDRGHEQR